MEKKNDKLILPSILLIISFVWNVALQTYWVINDEVVLDRMSYIVMIATVIGVISLTVYGFKYNELKNSKTAYRIGFGTYSLVNAYYFITQMIYGNLPIYYVVDFLLLLICTFMLLCKNKEMKQTKIIGQIIFITYALITLVLIIQDGTWYLSFYSSTIMDVIAFYIIWIQENKENRINNYNHQNTSLLEMDLIKLKQAYELGKISEQEYSEIKSKILNKL